MPLHFFNHEPCTSSRTINSNLKEWTSFLFLNLNLQSLRQPKSIPSPRTDSKLVYGVFDSRKWSEVTRLNLQVISMGKTLMSLGFRLRWLRRSPDYQKKRSSVVLIIIGSCFNSLRASHHMKIKAQQHYRNYSNPPYPHTKKNTNHEE